MSRDPSCSAFVCGCALVLVADDLSSQERQDALDALLYSQTAASRKVLELSAVESWAHANKMAMRVAGAVLADDREINVPLSASGAFTLLEIVQEINNSSEPPIKIPGGHWMSALKLEETSPTLDVLQKHVVHEGRWIRFMFAVFSPGITITTVVISFECSEIMGTNIFQHRFSADEVVGNISVSTSTALMDGDDYDFSRATVISLLGERRHEQIIALT